MDDGSILKRKSPKSHFFLSVCLLLSACNGLGQQIERTKDSSPATSFAAKQLSAQPRINVRKDKRSMSVFNFRFAAQRATLSTVGVKTSYLKETPKAVPDFYYDFFDKDVVGPYSRSSDHFKNRNGTASGVLISADGFIVTNYHVIQAADQIEVTLSDKRSYSARIIGSDKATDLALLKIGEKNLPFLPFGNSDSLMVGDIALIVGNPLNFTSTVTQGIISFKGRNIAESNQRWALQSYIQTDGVVNIGNSGGALVDLEGRLTGIITAIASPNGVYAGYSFAIPVEVVKKTADDLLHYGRAKRGGFGMSTCEMDAKKAAELNTPIVAGLLIENVEPAGAAQTGGLAAGDIIILLNNLPLESTAQLSELIARSHPGQKMTITFVRSGRRRHTEILLGNQAD